MVRLMLVALVLAASVGSATQAREEPQPLDYAQAVNWVCRPDLPGCRFDLTTTILGAGGPEGTESWAAAPDALADCFYVYPTVSESPGISAEPAVTEAELRAVRQQAARLGAVCRVFVPLHRQITYTSMRPDFPRPDEAAFEAADRLADADLLAAWDAYMARHNNGRPFVLIGHSQGASRLIRLIQQRIDGQPVQNRLLSAVLPGAFVLTSEAGDGTFKAVPPCRAENQTGCVIAFNAMRADTVVPADLKPPVPPQDVLCTNPAALGGGSGTLKAYLATGGETILPELTAPQEPWTRDGAAIATPFVALPGFYHAECRRSRHGAFLLVTAVPALSDVRSGALAGDWIVGGRPLDIMGLHLIDLNLVAGNLLEVIEAQLATWRSESVR